MNQIDERRVKRFRSAYPELKNMTNTEVLKMMNNQKKVKRSVDKELVRRIGELEKTK